MTGIATAFMDSSPIIAFTGQANNYSSNSSYMIGKDAFQEADIVGITMPITKYNFQAKRAIDLPQIIKEAFYVATRGRPGPVLIDLPKDVQKVMEDLGAQQAAWTGDYMDNHVEVANAWSKKTYNVEFIQLSKEEKAKWDALTRPITDVWIEKAKADGYPAEAIVADIKAFMKKY